MVAFWAVAGGRERDGREGCRARNPPAVKAHELTSSLSEFGRNVRRWSGRALGRSEQARWSAPAGSIVLFSRTLEKTTLFETGQDSLLPRTTQPLQRAS